MNRNYEDDGNIFTVLEDDKGCKKFREIRSTNHIRVSFFLKSF